MKKYILGALGGYYMGPAVVKNTTFQTIMKRLSVTAGISDTNVVFGGAAILLHVTAPLGESTPYAVGFAVGAMIATME